jgi:hypothetical membrane protein
MNKGIVFPKQKPIQSLAVMCMLLGISCAHVFAPVSYSWLIDTLDQLGAQGTPYAWIINTTWIISGGILGITLFKNTFTIYKLPFFLFCVCLILSGIFTAPAEQKHAIVIEHTDYELHSLFVQLSGIFLYITIFEHIILIREYKDKILNFIMLTAISVCTGIYTILPGNKGLFQRILYGICMIWILLFMNIEIYSPEIQEVYTE